MAADPRFTEDAAGVTYRPGPPHRIDLPTPEIGAQFRADGTIYTWDGQAWRDVPALAAAVRTQAEALAEARAILEDLTHDPFAGVERSGGRHEYECQHCTWSLGWNQPIPSPIPHETYCPVTLGRAWLAAQAADSQ
jgi:hypothetical protein